MSTSTCVLFQVWYYSLLLLFYLNPYGATTLVDDGKPDADSNKCEGCGACAELCPVEAIEMVAKAEA